MTWRLFDVKDVVESNTTPSSSTVSSSSTGWPKKLAHFLYALTSYALTSSNIDRFSILFYCLNQENIYNTTVTKDPTIPQVCRYTTL